MRMWKKYGIFDCEKVIKENGLDIDESREVLYGIEVNGFDGKYDGQFDEKGVINRFVRIHTDESIWEG